LFNVFRRRSDVVVEKKFFFVFCSIFICSLLCSFCLVLIESLFQVYAHYLLMKVFIYFFALYFVEDDL